MANRYPPTPSFGGAFPSLPYPSLPAQQNGHHFFAGRPPVTSPMGALHPASTGNSQSMNASNFAINAQIPSPGAIMPPIPPHQFPQELFKQLVNSSLPPPPPPSFPPVPIPNLGFSTYQPPPNLQNTFTTLQNHKLGNPTSNTANAFENRDITKTISEQPSEPIVGSREEGELSDGELEQHSAAESAQPESREQAAKMQISLNNGYTTLETQSPSGPSTRTSPPPALKWSSAGQKAADFPPTYSSQRHSYQATNLGNVLQSQHKIAPEIAPLTREDSGSSYDPPSVTTPDLAHDASDDRDETSQQAHNKSPSQMRELAKGALLSLAPHGIRYADLVKEGVDSDLLLQLYEEVGIKDCRPEISGDSRTYQVIHTPKQKAILSMPGPDKYNPSVILPHKRPSDIPDDQMGADLKEVPQIQQNMAESNSDLIGHSNETETLSRRTQPPPSISSDAHIATPAINVGMERKDRIAQLLAAKTGRSVPVRSTLDTAHIPVTVKLSAEIEPQVKTPANSSENAALPTASNQPTPKSAKNKAQTELVRQKMESLKKEAEAKARSQLQSQAFIPPSSNMPTSGINTSLIADTSEQPLSASLGTPIVAHEDHISIQKSLAASYSERPPKSSAQADHVYRIPGLFMTSDEPVHAEEQLSAIAVGQTDKSIRVSDHEHDFEHDSGASSVRDGVSAPGSLTEFNLASLGNQTSASRLPQKRPLASDSFDEPAPPINRSFGRKDSVEHIEIDISNEASEDGSDGIGMDIDEESQGSGLLINSAALSQETSEQDTQLSFPPTNLPERPSTQQHTTNSSLGLSTPSKEKDKENLWRAKNAEIEAMRKRIAEMEQRRKAKQSQSQAQSPQASLPSTPAPPKLHAPPPNQAPPSPGSVLHTYGTSPSQPLGSMHTALQKTTSGDHQLSSLNPPSQSATEDLSHDEDLRKKMARRKELQDGIPNLDAEVQATQLKLAQTKARLAAIKREAEKREAEIREARRREAEVAAEAMKLEEQLNMGLNGRSRFSEELHILGADLEAVPAFQTIFADSLEAKRSASGPNHPLPPTNILPHSTTQDMPVVAPATERESVDDGGRKGVIAYMLTDQIDNGVAAEEDAPAANSSNQPFSGAENSAPTATSVLSRERHSEFDEKSSSQSQIPADHDSQQSSIVLHHSDEESLGIDDFVEAPSPNLKGAATEIDYDNDGSVSMSDSGTDDYEPAEVPDTTRYSDAGPEWYKPDNSVPVGDSNQGDASDIDDDYEPAEEVESMELDLRNIQPISMNDYQLDRSRHPGPMDERSSDPYSPDSVAKPAIDDVEDGLEMAEANTLTPPQDFPPQHDAGVETDDVSNSDQVLATHFTAYESPLFFSKNFRFNPNFAALVAGGYNSLTYSNKIDPSRPLCPTEAEGGTCSDSRCGEQHFQEMTLPDDKILVEMSSARDFKQGDQRDKFLIGLKQVIAELRSTGVKEFPTVASALAAYRRTFAESTDPNRAIPS